jgi:hypothetical protein
MQRSRQRGPQLLPLLCGVARRMAAAVARGRHRRATHHQQRQWHRLGAAAGAASTLAAGAPTALCNAAQRQQASAACRRQAGAAVSCCLRAKAAGLRGILLQLLCQFSRNAAQVGPPAGHWAGHRRPLWRRSSRFFCCRRRLCCLSGHWPCHKARSGCCYQVAKVSCDWLSCRRCCCYFGLAIHLHRLTAIARGCFSFHAAPTAPAIC